MGFRDWAKGQWTNSATKNQLDNSKTLKKVVSGVTTPTINYVRDAASVTPRQPMPSRLIGPGKTFLMIFLAIIINFWIERNAAARFVGFDLTFFRNIVLSGDFFSLYQFLHFNIFFLIIVFAAINLRDGQNHIIRIWLSLILIFYLLSAIPILNQFLGVRTFLEFLMLFWAAIYLMFFKPDRQDFFMSTVLFWAFYNIYMFGGPYTLGGLVHFIWVIAFYMMFCVGTNYAQHRVQMKSWLLIIILFDFFMPQILASAFPNLPVDQLPFLTFGILIFAQVYDPSWLTILAIIIVMAFYFFQLTNPGDPFAVALTQRLGDDEQIQERLEILKVHEWLPERIREWTNRSVYYGAGQDYYAGQVDAYAKKDLGVYISDLENNIRNFYDNERIIIDATITGQNFVSEDDLRFEPIEVEVSCSAVGKSVTSLGKRGIEGVVFPKNKFTIEQFDTENVQCIFDKWQLENGRYDIEFTANFNFQTQAYVKRYFTSQEVVDAYKRRGLIETDEELLTLNDISDRKPQAQNSVGPVQVRTSSRLSPLIKISSEEDTRQLFGIILDNAWEGEVRRIKSLDVYVPSGVEMSPGECVLAMKESPIIDEPEFETYTKYILQVTNNPRLHNVKDNVDQRCWLAFKGSEIDSILEVGDVTTRFIHIRTDYDYTVKEQISIDVGKPPGMSAKLTSRSGKAIDSSTNPVCEIIYEKDSELIDWIAGVGEDLIKDVADVFRDDALQRNYNRVALIFALYENDELVQSAPKTCPPKGCKHEFDRKVSAGTDLTCKIFLDLGDIDRSQGYQHPEVQVQVKNSAPSLTTVHFHEEEYDRGDIATCGVSVSDADNDPITVAFNFIGLPIEPVEISCSGLCNQDIPTDRAEATTRVTCEATAFDAFGASETKEDHTVVKVS